MDFELYKRRLLISAALAVVLAACAWYYDAMLMTMLCAVAVMWQLVCLLYYLLRWNRGALAASGIRVLIWIAATAGAMTAHDYYAKLSRASGDALVAALQTYRAREGRYPQSLAALAPRDIPAIPTVALLPSREQQFRYRLMENHFRLMYIAGFRMASEYDSETAKWEELD